MVLQSPGFHECGDVVLRVAGTGSFGGPEYVLGRSRVSVTGLSIALSWLEGTISSNHLTYDPAW